MSTPTDAVAAGSTATTRAPGSVTGRWAARAVAVVRIAVGLFFVSTGLAKVGAHAAWAADFARWHVPLPGVAVHGVSAVEVVGGLALALGVAVRPAAALLAATMVGALVLAGSADGGQHLLLPPVLGAVSAAVALRGGGAWQLRPGRPRRGSRRS